jgi:hypothetical protein
MNASKALAVLVALAASGTCAFAAADFTTIRRTTTNLDDGVPKMLVSFTLPSTVNRSSSTSNSAVLELDVFGSEFNYNEVYINPPTTTCTDNGEDANQAASLGALHEHDDANMKVEWDSNHLSFSSSLLKTGTNQIMICIRNEAGSVGTGSGNLDNLSVKGIVLHYHTSE